MAGTSTPAAPADVTGAVVDLDVTGMTCASCASRIERKLNKLPGVVASVNLATERAHVVASVGTTIADLVATVEQTGYGASVVEPDPDPDAAEGRADAAERRLRLRVLVAAVLGLPVVVVSMVPALQVPGWQWVGLVLAAVVVLGAGWPFHRSALVNARHGAATMDTLISIGTLAALGWSAYALTGPAGALGYTHTFALRLERHTGMAEPYLEAAAAIPLFLLVGRWLEARARRRSGAALRALLALGAREARVLRDGREVTVPAASLVVGDRVVVAPGATFPVDGTVLEGHSAVDASSVTGESVPVEVGPSDAVVGGCVNTSGRLVVEATAVGADTQLARLAAMVTEAQSGKAAVQRLADRVSGIFVPVVLVLALVTLGVWLLVGAGASFAVTAAVAVLIIACPCALGLATPTALLVGTGRGAQLGIVIKGPEVLEATRDVDVVLLDKTGTVTEGRMTVVSVVPAAGVDEGELVRYAGAAEAGSSHPVAQAVAAHARDAGPLPDVTALREPAGQGVVAEVVGVGTVVVGRADLLSAEGLTVDAGLAAAFTTEQEQGRTVVLVGWSGQARGLVAVADTVRPSSAEAVRRLVALGLRPVLLTGDTARTAATVANEVGIDEVVADVRPEGKVDAVRRLQAEGRRVAMVGDGVNDAAALAQADLGIAMGTGTDAAIEAADLTLVRGDLLQAADAVRLARATLRTIRGNLFWAFAYNVAALPLAALGFANPVLAGAAMAFSSLFVVGNSLRLRRFAPLAS
ncbi:heavy metal translocating P-type ATPase [Microlunatus spumicola]|uniref:heavy metal translocating P-type ATPase n=1 Tax=Microlunatus spumicola TaxID=81499 RepID=UPI003CD082FD